MYIDDAEGLVFRPPSEARSFILRVTIGCSHNTCTFCAMYKASKFRIRSQEEIFAIIDRASAAYPSIRRIFLADGDALVLPTEKLLAILEKCYSSFPHLTRIGAYATPSDINRKTLQELSDLRQSGLKIIYTGIESGDDDVLRLVNKGVTAKETIAAGHKVLAAGMKFSAMIILGLGGKEHSTQHALHTARVVSAINPTMLSALTLIIPRDVPLYADVQEGRFTPLTAREFLEELDLILRNIDMKSPCIFRSNHVSNLYPAAGTLPMDKERMLAELEEVIPAADNIKRLLNDTGSF